MRHDASLPRQSGESENLNGPQSESGISAFTVWTIVYALIGVVAGILLLTSPLWGAALLWLWLGVSLLVLGIVQLVRALRFGSQAAVTP